MRFDGKRVKGENAMYSLVPYFLTKRYDAMNMITLDIPVEPMRKYMIEKRREGRPVSHLALIIGAFIRITAEFPALNRFVVGKKVYQRNDLTVSMVVLRPGTDEDTMSKIYFEPTDNIFEVNDKINTYISENRKDNNSNALDKVMKVLLNIPGLASIGTLLIRALDRIGLLPKSLIHASPFHATLLISNLGSIRTNHIYHHIYQFGTTSLAITMGNAREAHKRVGDTVTHVKCIPLGLVMDERICSGHYFAKAFSRMKEYLTDPTLMEAPYTPKAD